MENDIFHNLDGDIHKHDLLNKNDINKFLSLKLENEDNIISEEETQNQNDNNNIIEYKEEKGKSKCKLKYAAIIEKIRDKDIEKNYNKNEFSCNILLMPNNIELSDKISVLSLLSFCYQNNEKIELIYQISRKINKNKDKLKDIDPSFSFHIYFRTSHFLFNKENYLYSINYIFKTLKEMDKAPNILKNKKEQAMKLRSDIREKLINFLNNSMTKFIDSEFVGKCHDIQNLIKLIDNNKINIDSNEDKYLYAINKNWLVKLNNFLNDYFKSIETNNYEEFFQESFEPNNVFRAYFDMENKDENEKDNKKEKNKNSKNNKNNKNNNKKNKNYYSYPGPINNFYITDFKDYWNDDINLDENYFIKKELKINEDYYLINENEWNKFNSIFGSTNEIKRKNNNLDLIRIKFILFDKRINIENNNINLLKQKYIQINNKSNIQQLKQKIINISNYNLEKNKEKKNSEKQPESIGEKENLKNKKILFYILEKEKSEILIEMCYSFILKNKIYDSLYIDKLDLNDNENLNVLFSKYDKNKHILIIEVIDNDNPSFFEDLKIRMNNKYFCTICKNKIKHVNEKYNCNYCNLSIYCSKECAYQSTDHQNLDNKLSSILENKFNLSDLLSLNLDSILIKNKRRGITGLDNMGNTCYINSSIQCLSNTEDLTKYFLNEDFSKEINNGNTFGSKGVISNEYYKLINQLWNGSEQSITPKSFRLTFAKKEQAFYNNDQQDSQEFLLSLLNNLHEDLNRVTNKAYMEIKEQTKGESDESASKRFWDYNKSREDSIITDLFQGQYKSTIKCLNCENTSITYDNYLNLQLPIPSKKMQSQIKFLTYEGNCIDLNIKLEEKTELRNVIKNAILHLDNKKYLEILLNNKNSNIIFNYNNTRVPNNILYDNIMVCEFNDDLKMTNIYETSSKKINNKNNKNNINHITYDLQKLENICKNNELVLFEKDMNFIDNNNNDIINIFVYATSEIENSRFMITSNKFVLLSYPILITINRNSTLKDLQILILQKFSKILKKDNNNKDSISICYPHFTDKWEHLKMQGKKCPICKQNYNKSTKYCQLIHEKNLNMKISKLYQIIKDNISSKGVIILFAHSLEYNPNGEIYKGIKLSISDSKNENSDSKNNFTIYDSLELFKTEEILDGEEKWFCGKCQKHQKASKKMEIYRTPLYLIVHLKRFKQRHKIVRNIFGSKNDTFIDYKDILNLSDFVVGTDKKRSIYELYGVVLHLQIINHFGHYVALCKNKDRWIKYNDDKLFLSANHIDKDAYLLFYKRKSND